MNPTDQKTIRDDFITTIEAIDPSYDNYQDQPWRSVGQRTDVPGGALRNFFVRILPSDSNETGFYGAGIGRGANMQVWTCYKALPDFEEPIIDEDYLQLFHALQARLDPTLTGLCMVEVVEGGFHYEDDTPGHVWGYHPFRVEYMWRHTLDP